MNNLKKNGEFQIIYNSGRKSFGYYSLIFFKKNDNKFEKMWVCCKVKKLEMPFVEID